MNKTKSFLIPSSVGSVVTIFPGWLIWYRKWF